MFQWDDVPPFLAVVRHGSLARAAAALRVSESTVSRRIAAFETALGLQLFVRKRSGMVLTAAGQRVLRSAESMEAGCVELQRNVTGMDDEVAGPVRVAAVEELATYSLAPALGILQARWPAVVVDLVVSNSIADLTRQEAELAVRLARPTAGDLIVRQLTTMDCHAYGVPALVGVPTQELPWLEPGADLNFVPELHWLSEHAPARRTVLRGSSTAALATAASKGFGAILLPELLAREFPAVQRLDPDAAPLFSRSLWLVVHRELADVPRIRAAMEWVEAAIDG